MSRKQPPLEVTVELKNLQGEWVATAPKYGVSAKGITKKRATTNLQDKLADKLQRELTVVESIVLADDLQQRVNEYQKQLDLELKLRAQREVDTVFLAKDLILHGKLQQVEAAELLRVSPTWLAQLLKKESTGTIIKPPTDKRSAK